MAVARSTDSWDESDVRIRPSKKGSRPRTKDRPSHDDAETGRIRVFRARRVVDEIEDELTEMTMDQAKAYEPDAHLGDLVETEELDGLAKLLVMLEREVAPGLRVAFLRSRPGKGTITDIDRAWATSLYAAARRASVLCEVVHLATRGAIRPIPADVVGIR